jgi:hypothetical protein
LSGIARGSLLLPRITPSAAKRELIELTTAAILALSLSLAPASAREFHSGHARGFNGKARLKDYFLGAARFADWAMIMFGAKLRRHHIRWLSRSHN